LHYLSKSSRTFDPNNPNKNHFLPLFAFWFTFEPWI
jgi:hypothetical protein